eukprot:1233308-Rhodomonas_salina.5
MALGCSPEQPDDCIPTTCGDGRSHRSAITDTAFGNGKANNYPWSCSAYRHATGERQDGESMVGRWCVWMACDLMRIDFHEMDRWRAWMLRIDCVLGCDGLLR